MVIPQMTKSFWVKNTISPAGAMNVLVSTTGRHIINHCKP